MSDTQAQMRTTVPEENARTGAGQPAPVRRPTRRADWRTRGEIALLSGPALVVFIGFVILPVAMAAFYGFFKWNGYGWPTEFVGFGNYALMWQDAAFRDAVLHNFTIVVLSLVVQGPIAILFALLLNQKIRGRSLIRVLIFTPYVISEVVVGTGWSLMLQDTGALNSLLGKWGLEGLQQSWLADPAIAMTSLMVIISWKYIGFAVILMLAGMQSIPDELYEAAAIDGAGFWKTQWSITLPLLGPTVRIWAFLSIIGSLQLFDLVNIVWGQYISATAGTSTMATYMYQNGHLAGSYGYGNAVAVMLFLISLVVALVYQRFVLRRDTEGALTGASRRKGRA